ncbi:MAG: TetR/AcrR family transcriptional regulator, partial [Gemmatimonadetes bacterium]|nr:TetR/AcrR family transcriptional regulator [Gemmatimonadota bacterium]
QMSRVTGKERREQIIDAAIQLFAEAGFTGTTTRRLAEAAGISEAGLYLHFDTKEALYEAIIRRKATEFAGFSRRLRELMAGEPPRRVFGAFAEFMLETHTRDKAFLRLLLHSGLEQHALFQMFFRAQVRETADLLRSYVEEQQRAGAFRACEPRLVVRAFIGMLVHHLLHQEVFGVRELGVYTPEEAAPVFLSIFLDGVARPAAGEASNPAVPGAEQPVERPCA